MRKGLIDMLINHLLCLRAGYVLSDKPKDIKYVKNVDELISELQKLKENK